MDGVHAVLTIAVDVAFVVYFLGVIFNLFWVAVALIGGHWGPATRSPARDRVVTTLLGPADVPGRMTPIFKGLQAGAWLSYATLGGLVRPGSSVLQVVAAHQVSGLDRRVALGNLMQLAVVLSLAWWDLPWPPFVLAATALLLVATAARHVSYVVHSLPERLRRASSDPYIAFAVVVACDAGVLVAAVSVLFLTSGRLHMDAAAVRAAALDLFTLHALSDVARMNPARAIVSLLGLLAYTVLLKSILGGGAFKRTDEDCRSLAVAYTLLGRFEVARTWVGKEQQRVSVSHRVRAGIYLGSKLFERALAEARRELQAEGRDDTLDVAIHRLWMSSVVLPWTPTDRLEFCAQCLAWNVADAEMSLQVGNCVAWQLVPVHDLVLALGDLLPQERYPLTLAVLHCAGREYARAWSILDAARPGLDIDELLRLVLLCQLELGESGDVEAVRRQLDRWSVTSLPTVRDLARRLDPEWEAAAMTSLFALLRAAKGVGSELAGDIEDLVFKLQGERDDLDRWLDVPLHELGT